MPNENLLIIANSERNADLFYATGFLAPDPFIFIETRGRRYLLANDLEIDRAKKESSVRNVVSASRLAREYKERTGRPPALADLAAYFLKKLRVRRVTVPGDLSLSHALILRKAGIKLDCKRGLLWTERLRKNKKELRAINRAMRATEEAVAAAVTVLKRSVIRRGSLYFQGKPLTSEALRTVIHRTLLDHGCTGEHTIVSCGPASANPHERGSGPLKPDRAIVMDIFPRADGTRYYADFTRTVVRGKAPARIKKMYAAVKEAQSIAFKMIRHGVLAKTIHEAIQERFTQLGFKTGVKNGKMQGFFHSTGHGLGLDIHEPPRLGPGNDVLKAGNVVTVEPGLYYPGIGGVRLEDVVLVTKTGCINITRFPKRLEI